MNIFFINLLDINFTEVLSQKYLPFLDSSEQERFSKMTVLNVKRNFLFGRVLAKTHLGKILKCKPAEVVLSISQGGRLELGGKFADSGLSFNISHSNNMVFVAISQNLVGIDIEFIKDRNFDQIANYHFTQKEAESLKALDKNSEEFKEAFYAYWTLKESFIKCNGKSVLDKDSHLEFLLNFQSKEIKTSLQDKYQFLTVRTSQDYILSISSKVGMKESLKIEEVLISNDNPNQQEIVFNMLLSS